LGPCSCLRSNCAKVHLRPVAHPSWPPCPSVTLRFPPHFPRRLTVPIDSGPADFVLSVLYLPVSVRALAYVQVPFMVRCRRSICTSYPSEFSWSCFLFSLFSPPSISNLSSLFPKNGPSVPRVAPPKRSPNGPVTADSRAAPSGRRTVPRVLPTRVRCK
jgi:hypothetical protein